MQAFRETVFSPDACATLLFCFRGVPKIESFMGTVASNSCSGHSEGALYTECRLCLRRPF